MTLEQELVIDQLKRFSFGWNIVEIVKTLLASSDLDTTIFPKDTDKVIVFNKLNKKAVVVSPVIEDRGVDLDNLADLVSEAKTKLLDKLVDRL